MAATWSWVLVLLAHVCDVSAAGGGGGDSALSLAQWKKGLDVAWHQGATSQQMIKEFFLFAGGTNPWQNLETMKHTIDDFDHHLKDLIDGTKDGKVHAAPSATVLYQLKKVKEAWLPFKQLLTNNGTGYPYNGIPQSVLREVMTGSYGQVKASKKAAILYEYEAIGAFVYHPNQQIISMAHQPMVVEKICKEVALVGLPMDKEANLDKLRHTKRYFHDTHSGILQGLDFMGLSSTTNMCTLKQMRTISAEWAAFEPLLDNVIYNHSATDDDLQKISHRTELLYSEVNLGMALYLTPSTDCTVEGQGMGRVD